jgi:hypothetical protein
MADFCQDTLGGINGGKPFPEMAFGLGEAIPGRAPLTRAIVTAGGS